MTTRTAPFGAWKSPITADLIASATIGLGQIALEGKDVYWIETRPQEAGRNVIVRCTADGQRTDVTPAPLSARTRAHDYGGGDFVVDDGSVYFSNFADQRLYRQSHGLPPQPITPESSCRYADAVVDRRRGRLLCVREDHPNGAREPSNTLASVDVNGRSCHVLASSHDFYAAPRLSPDGSRLAWLAWNHPNMPWDETELWVAELETDGALARTQCVAGGAAESIFQPEWSPDGVLHFVSDRTGWWNLYRWHDGHVEPLCEMAAEFGRAQWVFGMSSYGFESAQRIICSYTQNGTWSLAQLETATRKLEPIDTPFSEIAELRVAGGRAVMHAGSPTEAPAIVCLDLATRRFATLGRSRETSIDPGYISTPEPIEFPTEHGRTAHAFFYPPCNRDCAAAAGTLAPLLVKGHGGPTAAASSVLDLKTQYWTSRGFAVVDVNYGGSTGYGRAYRRRLEGQWGVVDVDDCVNAASYLAGRGRVDANRLAISGRSAGGYTTLCCLTFRTAFKAGASYYGIGDLEALARDTHKFEAHYTDRLVGPYPECAAVYRARSPIHFADRLSCPVIFFQGLDDRVVPPSQAEAMVAALRAKRLPVAYLAFPGEQHGFRRAETIKRALEAELYFYSRVFGFTLAEPVEPVAIENEGG